MTDLFWLYEDAGLPLHGPLYRCGACAKCNPTEADEDGAPSYTRMRCGDCGALQDVCVGDAPMEELHCVLCGRVGDMVADDGEERFETFADLVRLVGWGFHPDTPMASYVYTENGEPMFTARECERGEALIEAECANSADQYETVREILEGCDV